MSGDRRTRLEKVARPLTLARGPYYRWEPGPNRLAEPAPGWYIVTRKGASPTYIGANAVDAELYLRELVAKKRGGAKAVA
jgi:hypothetical protein